MTNEEKLLPDFGLAVYDELLKAHGLNVLETVKASKSMSITYNKNNRILSFSFGNEEIKDIVVTDDGLGNVIITLPSAAIVTDDNNGNVIVTGLIVNDDGKGNIYTN